MTPIETTATVGPDGWLRLDLFVGLESAGQEVVVTIELVRTDKERPRPAQNPPDSTASTEEKL